MKKQIVILALGLLLVFSGCSDKNAQSTEPQVEQQQTEIAEENPTEQQELTVKLAKWQPKEGEIAPQEISPGENQKGIIPKTQGYYLVQSEQECLYRFEFLSLNNGEWENLGIDSSINEGVFQKGENHIAIGIGSDETGYGAAIEVVEGNKTSSYQAGEIETLQPVYLQQDTEITQGKRTVIAVAGPNASELTPEMLQTEKEIEQLKEQENGIYLLTLSVLNQE